MVLSASFLLSRRENIYTELSRGDCPAASSCQHDYAELLDMNAIKLLQYERQLPLLPSHFQARPPIDFGMNLLGRRIEASTWMTRRERQKKSTTTTPTSRAQNTRRSSTRRAPFISYSRRAHSAAGSRSLPQLKGAATKNARRSHIYFGFTLLGHALWPGRPRAVHYGRLSLLRYDMPTFPALPRMTFDEYCRDCFLLLLLFII